MRRILTVAAVVAATLAGSLVALEAFRQQKEIRAGTIELGVEPGHRGALDVYVPLVDWGVRFPGVRLPARLTVQVRAVDRDTAEGVAVGGRLNAAALRDDARDAVASYLRMLVVVVVLCGLALGALVALAVHRPRMIAVAGGTAVAGGIAIALLLPPRGSFDDPQYYARGPDIPVALRALEEARGSAARLGEELDAQLVGLARLVRDPARRPQLARQPRLVLAGDLHNNVLALDALRRVARGSPVLFCGDLTDRGSAREARAVQRVVGLGRPFVFVSGNHDSDTLERRLRRAGAIVLDRDSPPARVAGLRIAGYDSPNRRRSGEGYRDRGSRVTREQQEEFTSWLLERVERVDVVMVHEPELVAPALRVLRADTTLAHKLVVAGHTHRATVDPGPEGRIPLVNPGSLGAGGTGNLAEPQDLGIATVAFARAPFRTLAVDTVEIDPGSGSATANRVAFGP